MTVLGIETSTAVASVGIARDGRIVAERSESRTRGHAESLPRLVADVLARAGADVDALEGVAVAVGPGSFTGLRVGLGFAKGLAYAGSLPIAGVPTLHALALGVERDGMVFTCLDARKGEVYLAAYIRRAEALEEVLPVAALPPEAAVHAIASRFSGERRLLVGDGPERYAAAFHRLREIGVETLPFSAVHPRGGIVATIGAGMISASGGSRAADVVPFYVRPSAAELRPRAAEPSH